MMTVTIRWQYVIRIFGAALFVIFVNEFFIYYLVLLQCTWPRLTPIAADSDIVHNGLKPEKVMLLADPHLLGPRRGHWFDKLRREWQMSRAFRTAMLIHSPSAVFILGDIFDEGLWVTDAEFKDYVDRYKSIFSHGDRTEVFIVVGNHDTGFHYMSINKKLLYRFEESFGSSVRMINLRGNLFVLINSMAMEGDNCYMCTAAMEKLQKISTSLQCAQADLTMEVDCRHTDALDAPFSRPILLQHFPLYRPSDMNCTGTDAAPFPQRRGLFRERWECLSRKATQGVLSLLQPRLVFTAHTHYGCYQEHMGHIPEYTIPSFSWRNINNPSFMLLTISNNNYAVSKCYMPKESTVIYIYIFGGVTILVWFYFTRRAILKPKYVRDTFR